MALSQFVCWQGCERWNEIHFHGNVLCLERRTPQWQQQHQWRRQCDVLCHVLDFWERLARQLHAREPPPRQHLVNGGCCNRKSRMQTSGSSNSNRRAKGGSSGSGMWEAEKVAMRYRMCTYCHLWCRKQNTMVLKMSFGGVLLRNLPTERLEATQGGMHGDICQLRR